LKTHKCKTFFNGVKPNEGDNECLGVGGLIEQAEELGELVGFYDLNRENPNLNKNNVDLKTKKKSKILFDTPLTENTSKFINDFFNNDNTKKLLHTEKFDGTWSLSNEFMNLNWKLQ